MLLNDKLFKYSMASLSVLAYNPIKKDTLIGRFLKLIYLITITIVFVLIVLNVTVYGNTLSLDDFSGSVEGLATILQVNTKYLKEDV